MIISLNWLKKFVDIDISIEDLSVLIGSRLVEIENVINLNEKYKNVIIVSVKDVKKIDGSDHLTVIKIDDGGIVDGLERDENELIQVVCGASNMRAGLTVAWLPPESIVPETINSSNQLHLDTRIIMGYKSNGMIASSRELDLYDDHSGILEINEDITPGTSFSEAFELDDYLLDIENKSLTHRPDCFGIIGFAREVSAILGKKFNSPDWFMDIHPNFETNDKLQIFADILDKELSDRYQAVVMSNVNGDKKSPMLVQTYLSRVGIRPINAIVDATNYLMLMTGQPLHAFDYDKFISLSGGKPEIFVRSGKQGESLTLIDGRIIRLTNNDIVISAGNRAVALAGAMGGAETEVDENTKNIIIESASFNLFKLRATQMRHGIFSEAITRFTKGQPTDLTTPVLNMAVRLMTEWLGATVSSGVADCFPVRAQGQKIELSSFQVNNILGSNLNIEELILPLVNAEFTLERIGSDSISITSPWWRSDIHIKEDIIEEIARINGYDNIEQTLPFRNFTAVKPSEFDSFKSKIRKILARGGANEILTYNFIHGDILKKADQDVENSYRIINSISPELQYYRQTLTPSLLNMVHHNIKQGYAEFALFEINKTHKKSEGLNEEKVPIESESLSLVMTRKESKNGTSYYQAKRFFEYLCQFLGVKVEFQKIEKDENNPSVSPFEKLRSSQIKEIKSGSVIGYVGEYKKSVMKNFKLPEYSAGFEIDTVKLFNAYQDADSNYRPISRYPSSDRDICFQVNPNQNYSSIVNALESFKKDIDYEIVISPVDIYQPIDGITKNITFNIKITSYNHTLTSEEVNECIDHLIESVKKVIDVKII
ncbi:MAG TPA: phenylalanine--tRNA ligase subunit beta [Candidatus Saccharibacteria bacterium]|nr:phenylalanine--tRNA ligase subunit beta [Candidatus Saccharibacteria bacterium]